MTKPLMSDAELRRRKKVQGTISQTTGVLGLTALGGTLAASRGGRNTLRKIPKLREGVTLKDRKIPGTKKKIGGHYHLAKPPPKDPNRDRIKGATIPILATSAGLGGAGSFNFAAYTNAESRKRKQMNTVRKSEELCVIAGEVAKKWEPVATDYSPENRRRSRNEFYPAAAAGAGGAGATAFGVGAVGQRMKSKTQIKGAKKATKRSAREFKAAETVQDAAVRLGRQKKEGTSEASRKLNLQSKNLTLRAHKSRTQAKNLKVAARGSRNKAVALASGAAATAAASAGAHRYLKRKAASKEWASYSKRSSPFGIEHD